MSYTLGTAAIATGLNKSTILRSIRSGKISATRTEHGTWSIDASELHRVYPPLPLQQQNNGSEQRHAIPDETPAMVAELRAVIADLRSDRDHWREVAQRLVLPDRREPQSWWRWLRSA